jgi:hypothetical protein
VSAHSLEIDSEIESEDDVEIIEDESPLKDQPLQHAMSYQFSLDTLEVFDRHQTQENSRLEDTIGFFFFLSV